MGDFYGKINVAYIHHLNHSYCILYSWKSTLRRYCCKVVISFSITHVITPTEALSVFLNSVVIMIASLFIVGAGIFNTG